MLKDGDTVTVSFVEDMELTDADVIETQDGYLACTPRVARVGIQVYSGDEVGMPQMDQVRVWRPEEEVFSPDSMRSFAYRPITNDHPAERVTAKNWKKLATGQAGGDIARDGDFIRVPMALMDQGAIEDYRRGKKQLSAGYTARLVWGSGKTPTGDAYDAKQTTIRANHIAQCDSARGGPKLSIGDSFASFASDQSPRPQPTNDRRDTMNDVTRTITVDSIPLQVSDIAAGVINRTIERLTADRKEMKTKLADATGAAAAAQVAHDALVADLQKQIATKDGEIAALNQKVKDAELTPAVKDAMVRDRMDVVIRARSVLGDSFVVDGKSDADIRRAVCIAKLGDAAVKGMSDDGVAGAFSALTTIKSGGGHHTDSTVVLAQHLSQPGPVADNRAQLYDARTERLKNAFKSPVAAA